jgi:hypothetical protein
VSDDFRSDPMPTAEGHGQARSRFQQAWTAYENAVRPAIEPAGRWVAGRVTEDLVGFWLIWHLHGGFEGVQKLGMSRSAIYRRIKLFRRYFGAHPDDYEMPGVTIDVEAYLRGPIPPGVDA